MASTIAKTVDGIRRLNTKVEAMGDQFYVTLYETMVYSEDKYSITLNSGGWITPTTTSRIRQALRHRGHPHNVNIKNGVMHCDGKPFVNNIYVISKGA